MTSVWTDVVKDLDVRNLAAPRAALACRVLVVEDDPLFRKFSVAALRGSRRLTVHAESAASLAEAGALLSASHYDCILLDLGLPDVEGIQTVRAVLQASPGTPIVVLTGEEDAAIAQEALRAGAQDFLEKVQADAGVLDRAIHHAVERGRWAAELAAKNQMLEARNVELDEFAHVISHDLKAPLRAIYHLVHDADEHLREGDAEAAREQLDGVEPRVQRLFGMIDGVLRLAQAGRAATQPVTLPVERLVEEVVEGLGPPTGFEVRIQPGMPTLYARPEALAQVFQNLVENAMKHHPRKAGRIDIGWRDAGRLVEFTVADDGAGIPEHLHERAFRPFQTLGRETSGSGLGLALVRKLVEANGGTIGIDACDKGACLRFSWPKEA